MIELQNVTKIYNAGKSNQTKALDSVSLTIGKGEMAAIVGASGAGKSTLLHVIGCLCDIQGGKYLFDGVDIGGLSADKKSKLRNQKIGIVMQDFALVDEYSVMDNVMLPLLFRKGAKDKSAALKALERTGISALKNKKVTELSGGEKQRCAIARCLCQNPEVILADEPTGQLDSGNSENIMNIFRELNADGMTVIIVTHDGNVARKCNRMITVSDGKIINDTKN